MHSSQGIPTRGSCVERRSLIIIMIITLIGSHLKGNWASEIDLVQAIWSRRLSAPQTVGAHLLQRPCTEVLGYFGGGEIPVGFISQQLIGGKKEGKLRTFSPAVEALNPKRISFSLSKNSLRAEGDQGKYQPCPSGRFRPCHHMDLRRVLWHSSQSPWVGGPARASRHGSRRT